jgi:hypothetical protein
MGTVFRTSGLGYGSYLLVLNKAKHANVGGTAYIAFGWKRINK